MPNPGFSTALALWCAGKHHDVAQIQRFNDEVVKRSKALQGGILITSDISNHIEHAKILVSHATRVPNKVQKFGLPTTPRIAKSSMALIDYCRLVGFPEELLSGSCRPEYQQVFQFNKALNKGIRPPLKFTVTQIHKDFRPLHQAYIVDSSICEEGGGYEAILHSDSEKKKMQFPIDLTKNDSETIITIEESLSTPRNSSLYASNLTTNSSSAKEVSNCWILMIN